MTEELIIQDLHVSLEDKEIIKGINLKLKRGEVVALMGPNGSGKSTLGNVLMGSPKYKITKGKIFLNNEDITEAKPEDRAKKGLFLSFQYPAEISGVTLSNFLRTAYNTLKNSSISVIDFYKLLKEKMAMLKMDDSFSRRYLNEGFSGGEKKKAEILQLAVLEPKFAIIDEVDSGTDVDAMKILSDGINKLKREKNMGIFIITHYNRILEYIKPDRVIVLVDGKFTKEGNYTLAHDIEKLGYSDFNIELSN